MIPPRTIVCLIIFLCGVGMVGYTYYSTEYITNKGPDDYWTQSYVAAYLTEKYGSLENGDSLRIQITGFKPDEPQGKKGLYTIVCKYKGKPITVQTYYAGGKFYDWRDFPTVAQ